MRILLTLACVAALGGCAIIVSPNDDIRVHSFYSTGSAIEGNGMAARDERAVAAAQQLDVSGPIMVEVRVGAAPQMVVEADSNLLPLIRTEVRGDELRIWTDASFSTRNPIRITYSTPQLVEVRSSGSGRITVSGLAGAPLKVRKNGSGRIELSGQVAGFDAQNRGSGTIEASGLRATNANLSVSSSGSIRVGEIRGQYANVSVSSSGSVQAEGAVQSLTARVNSSGSINLEGLVSEHADLSTNSSGGIGATVRQSLVAQTSSSGTIRVYGNPGQRSLSGKRVYLLN
jgi:hypothetical protein